MDWCYRLDKYVYCLHRTLDIFKDTQHSDIQKLLPYSVYVVTLHDNAMFDLFGGLLCDGISTCMFQWLQLSERTKCSAVIWHELKHSLSFYSDLELDISTFYPLNFA